MGFYGEDDASRLIEAGWVLVPPDPTEAMIEAGGKANCRAGGCADFETCPYCAGKPMPSGDDCTSSALAAYRAMLAAAPIPTPPQLKEG